MKKILYGLVLLASSTAFMSCETIEEDGSIISINDNITSATTWYADKVYMIDNSIYIDDATLTIEPGTVIKFKADANIYVGYSGNARIIANGTADKRIVFTSQTAVPTAGSWGAIYFYQYALQNTSLTYCTFEYGGTQTDGVLNFSSSKATVNNCIFRHTPKFALITDKGFVSFQNNEFTNIGSHALKIHPEYIGSIGLGNQYTLGENYGILVTGDRTNTAATWKNPGVPFFIDGDVDIEAALTIEAGNVFKFRAGTKLEIGYYENTTFIANGTLENPIVFTSSAPSPTAGAWAGLIFYGHTLTNSSMEYCTVEFGGDQYGAIKLYDTKININRSSLRQAPGYGIHALMGFSSFGNNSLQNLGNHAIYTTSQGVSSIDGSNVFLTPNNKGIEISGGRLDNAVTWKKQTVPYYVTQNIDIEDVLTIEAGAIFKFSATVLFEVGYYENSAVIVQGTELNPVTFTSSATYPTSGSWGGFILYEYTMSNTSFSFCSFEYGGDLLKLYSGASASVANCWFMNAAQYGIWVDCGATLNESGNTFQNCASGNIYYCN